VQKNVMLFICHQQECAKIRDIKSGATSISCTFKSKEKDKCLVYLLVISFLLHLQCSKFNSILLHHLTLNCHKVLPALRVV